MHQKRSQWASNVGFILAAAGSAVITKFDSSRSVITWSYDYFLYITWNKSIIH